jgi:hypothetical protein
MMGIPVEHSSVETLRVSSTPYLHRGEDAFLKAIHKLRTSCRKPSNQDCNRRKGTGDDDHKHGNKIILATTDPICMMSSLLYSCMGKLSCLYEPTWSWLKQQRLETSTRANCFHPSVVGVPCFSNLNIAFGCTQLGCSPFHKAIN